MFHNLALLSGPQPQMNPNCEVLSQLYPHQRTALVR